MDNVTIACMQPRTTIVASSEEFQNLARRFLHQARAKAAQVAVFPELAGMLIAPPLISSLKLGFIRRADQGRRPKAGIVTRGVGQVAEAMAGMLGGGFRGSVGRLLEKNSGPLEELYVETFGELAREYGLAVVAGSLYLKDEESGTVRNRAYLFDTRGDVIGHQDKLHLNPGETGLVAPGQELTALETSFGRVGLLLGRDALYPELARWLAIQGADLLLGIAACPGEAQARMIRTALGLRAEENQVFASASFLLGPNYFDPENGEEYFGQSAVLAPISVSPKADGVLVQTGSARTEGIIATVLDGERLAALRESSGFRPRQEMHLGAVGASLAEFYDRQLTIEQAIAEGYGREQVAEAPAEWEEGFLAEPAEAQPAVAEPVWAEQAVAMPEWTEQAAAKAEDAFELDEELSGEEEVQDLEDLTEPVGAEPATMEPVRTGPEGMEPGVEAVYRDDGGAGHELPLQNGEEAG